MATQVTSAKVAAVRTNLEQANLTGLDWAAIIKLLLSLIGPLLGGICPVPVATRRIQNFGRVNPPHWYVGMNMDHARVDQGIDDSGILTGDGDNPANRAHVKAALRDVAGIITVAETAALIQENAPPH